MRIEWSTPGYMVREELQRVKLRCRARGRAWNFAKLIGGGQKKWVGK